MQIVFPYLILSILSYFLVYKIKISLAKSYLITSIMIIFFLILFGKFGLLNFSIITIQIISVVFFFYLISKKIFNKKILKQQFILLIIYFLLIWICKDLFYYKFDEFSEYGISTRLIFSENNLPVNIDYLSKGSHFKVNFVSYFHYFFLKNSTIKFDESISYIAHSFLIFILFFNILAFIKINVIKKIFILLIFYFTIYALGPGIDRLYVDTIVGLIISLILLHSFNEKKHKSDYFLIFLLVTILPLIKPNGIIIVIGITPIIIFQNFYKKKFIVLALIIASLLTNHLFTKFYFSDLNKIFTQKEDLNQIYELHESMAFNLNQLHQLKQFRDEAINLNSKFIYNFSSKQLNNLIKNGIYHSKTFLIYNRLFSKLNLDINLIQIPINIFIWFIIIIFITYFINKKKNTQMYWLSFLYIGFIVSYYLMLIFWGLKHNLITNDFEMKVSWERHIGSLLIGIILFLFVNFFKIFNNIKTIILFLFFTISLTVPNSLRPLMSYEITKKEQYWKSKIEQRKNLQVISNKIKSNINIYSNVLLAFDKRNDPYFETILKYELIEFNTFSIDGNIFLPSHTLFKFLNNRNNLLGNNRFYIIKDKEYELEEVKQKLNRLYTVLKIKQKLSLIKNFTNNDIEIYEVITDE